ncbi:MAG: hypothetical protein OIF47_07640 [Marinibacterium sp.]|nr:hypothetical protein [Marinibacterium sp.]
MATKSILSALVVAGVTASAAFASDAVLPSQDSVFEKWGDAEGWTVFVDTTRKSCLIERTDDNANVVQMGLTADHSLGYLGVFTKADIDLKGSNEQIIVALGDNIYAGEAHKKTKHLADGYKGGYLLTDSPEFVEDVMKQHVMIVFPEKEFAFAINLDGTFKAIEAATKCNEEQLGG